MKLPKVYEPAQYESDIYALWEKSDSFLPKNRGDSKSFSIVVPPPNANGDLHLGHGLTLAIEDILIRYHRLRGRAALLVPGADHAGFETQVVYEKQLAKEGKSRFDFSREELYQQIWDFVAQNRQNYEDQFRKLGASVDWSRFTFTLDQKIVERSYKTFQKMWDDGLIYRGERLVNFCTFHGTAFADIEVVHKEVQGGLWHIKYPLTDGSGEVVVATTRPETMLGDTAVAVHPKDPRYKNFLGKTIRLPLTQREIPIIADDMVDPEYGSGAVKITPAHDPNDFEVAKRHDLPFITVINHEGKLTHDIPKPYIGLTVQEGRTRIVADLEKQGLVQKTESVTHSVGHCYKCENVIEPLLRDQWFIDMQPLAKRAIEALNNDQITFYPASKKGQTITYLEGLRDWNISRQIAWGIPVPAFQNIDEPEDWIYDENVDQEFINIGNKTYRRDPDVFDTWFSSSSWPFSTLDYPDGQDFKKFYPLNLMETGADILYQWVSRMIMLGLYVTDEVPFKNVYLHGLILDQHSQKMSKSKGNVVDPMQKIDQYGSDAFRMGIIAGQSPGSNQPYDESKVVGARNFCNKLWNVARFVEGRITTPSDLRAKPSPETPADHWMLSKLQHSTERVAWFLDHYRLSEAYETVYHLLWDDFADWYIEASKGQGNNSVLLFSLETILKLAHPFAPFVTETIWQTLAQNQDSILATAGWPEKPKHSPQQAETFETIKSVVTEVRAITSKLKISGLNLYHTNESFLNEHAALIAKMASLQSVKEVKAGHGLHLTQTSLKCWLDIDEHVARNYLNELESQQERQRQLIKQLETRLNNKSYTKNAPRQVVDQTKSQLKESKELLAKITKEHQKFASASR